MKAAIKFWLPVVADVMLTVSHLLRSFAMNHLTLLNPLFDRFRIPAALRGDMVSDLTTDEPMSPRLRRYSSKPGFRDCVGECLKALTADFLRRTLQTDHELMQAGDIEEIRRRHEDAARRYMVAVGVPTNDVEPMVDEFFSGIGRNPYVNSSRNCITGEPSFRPWFYSRLMSLILWRRGATVAG